MVPIDRVHDLWSVITKFVCAVSEILALVIAHV